MQLKEFLKSEEIKSPSGVYLIYGEENYFIDQLSRALKELHNATVLWGDEVTIRDLLLNINSGTFLHKKPVFLVRHAQETLFKDQKALLKLHDISKKHSGAVFFHLDFVNSEKDLGELGSISIPKLSNRRLDQKALLKLIQEQFSKQGIKIDPKVAQQLIDLVDKDLMKLRFEARKFFSLGISELTEDLIYELIPPEGEVQTLELMDALLNSDFDKAYKYLDRAFGASFLILSGLLSLTFRLYLLHLLTLKGLDKEKALTSLELRPPLSYKFQSYLKVPMARIKRLLELLALAERDIKLNLKDPSYALRLAVIKFIIYEKFSKVQGD